MTKRYKNYKRRIEEIIWMLVTMAGLFVASCVYAFHTALPLQGTYAEAELDASVDLNDSFNSYNSHSDIYPNLEEQGVYSYEYTTEIQGNTAEDGNTEIGNGDSIDNTGDIDDINDIDIDNTDDFEADAVDISGELENDGVEWRYRLTEHELNLIAAIAMLEDSGAMTAISEVILNRVESGNFGGNTVSEVIYEKGQFYAVKFVDNSVDASEEALEAVLAVFRDGVSVVGEAEFFAEKSVNPEKIAKGLYLIDNIGDTNFYGQK